MVPDAVPAAGDRRAVLPYIALVVGIPVATVLAGVFTLYLAASGGDTIAPVPTAVKRGLVVEDTRAAGRPAAGEGRGTAAPTSPARPAGAQVGAQ